MIITISGKPGSGKSVITKLLAKRLKLREYSVGDYMRKIARKRKISLLKLSKEAEKSRKIDKQLDKWQKSLNKKKNFVINSRLGFYFIPKSIKIFLDVNSNEAARRIYNDRKRKTEKENITLAQTKRNIKKRIGSEKQRYKKYYNLNPYLKKNYDFWLDTTKLNIKQVVDKVLEFVKD